MRKYIVGFIAGALAFTAVQASADGIKSLVNEKVGSVWELNVNGEAVGEVPIIKGSSYAPVRQIAEIAGMDVDFEQGKVFLTTKIEDGLTGPTPTEYRIGQINETLKQAKSEIEGMEKIIAGSEKTHKQLLAYDPNISDEYIAEYEKTRQENLSRIDVLKAEIVKLEAELAELKSA
ncbi:hypothetical protein ACX93W_12555 [Paenibacillus sp. CAU 1782]